jgi:hypothetical protein
MVLYCKVMDTYVNLKKSPVQAVIINMYVMQRGTIIEM